MIRYDKWCETCKYKFHIKHTRDKIFGIFTHIHVHCKINAGFLKKRNLPQPKSGLYNSMHQMFTHLCWPNQTPIEETSL